MNALAHETLGEGPALAFVHGFTQTRHSWLPLLDTMTTRVRATLIDAPGHGDSAEPLNLRDTADAIAALVPQQTLVGYSMGARMCLTAAIRHAGMFPRLILISGTAGLDTEDERSARRTSDDELARTVATVGVPAFVETWLSNPMFAGLSREHAQIDERLRNTAHGLAGSLREAGTGTMEPLWGSLPFVAASTLIIAGEKDTKFEALAERMHSLIPHSELRIHPGTGHTVHLEDPDGCADIIDDWLSRT